MSSGLFRTSTVLDLVFLASAYFRPCTLEMPSHSGTAASRPRTSTTASLNHGECCYAYMLLLDVWASSICMVSGYCGVKMGRVQVSDSPIILGLIRLQLALAVRISSRGSPGCSRAYIDQKSTGTHSLCKYDRIPTL